MKTIKGFENEDIVVSDFGEWVGKDHIDYKFEYKNNRKIIKGLLKENKQLKDNWDKLKEYIRETKLKEFEKSYGKRYGKTFTQAEVIVCNMILDKMQELEQGSDNK